MTPHKLFALSLGIAGMVFVAAQAQAQSPANCASRDTVVQSLADTYGETRQAIGIAANNAVMEVFASESSGSWTITVTLPDGMMCLVASGQDFEAVADPLAKPGDDA